MTKEQPVREPIFVPEKTFREDPRKYMEQATTTQRVAVFNTNHAIVLSMGGTYRVPE